MNKQEKVEKSFELEVTGENNGKKYVNVMYWMLILTSMLNLIISLYKGIKFNIFADILIIVSSFILLFLNGKKWSLKIEKSENGEKGGK